MKVKMILMLLLVAMTTMGFECVNDDAVFSVNISGISGKYDVPQGSTAVNQTWTFNSSQYLGGDYGTLTNVRIYDIRVTTEGTFGGTINGSIALNGSTVLSIVNKSWSSFASPGQSLITSSLFNRPANSAAALAAVVSAIQKGQDVTLGVNGTLSSAAPAGLKITIEVLGQVDATL